MMELRVLRYFIEVAREGGITGAARALHISQPTLSKQLKELEAELGCKLFVRGNYNVHLTEEGILLRKRAEDILDMADKTVGEFQSLNDVTGGDVRIGCAESWLIHDLANAVKDFRRQYPGLRFHITSGDTRVVVNDLEQGLSDFAVIVEPPDLSKYNYLSLPGGDTWGAFNAGGQSSGAESRNLSGRYTGSSAHYFPPVYPYRPSQMVRRSCRSAEYHRNRQPVLQRLRICEGRTGMPAGL